MISNPTFTQVFWQLPGTFTIISYSHLSLLVWTSTIMLRKTKREVTSPPGKTTMMMMMMTLPSYCAHIND